MALDTILFRQNRPVSKFRRFQLLPSELRIKIWKLAVQEPRVITIICDAIHMYPTPPTLRAENSNPGVLRANRESREVALKEGTFGKLEFGDVLTKAVHFNFERDTLLFYTQDIFYLVFGYEGIPLRSVQNITIRRERRIHDNHQGSIDRIHLLTSGSEFKLRTLVLQNFPKRRFGIKIPDEGPWIANQKRRIEMLAEDKHLELSFISRDEMKKRVASSG